MINSKCLLKGGENMKKILPIVLVLIVVGVGAFIFINRGPKGTTGDIDSQNSPSSDTFSGALKDAVKLGIAMKCTYKVEGNEYESFIKGENYRGKIKTAEGKTGEIIIKNNCMWTWSEGEAQGMKICFEESDLEMTNIWEQPQGAFGPDIAYTCLPTVVTDAKFTLPSNVNFMDIDEMMDDDAMKEGFGY